MCRLPTTPATQQRQQHSKVVQIVSSTWACDSHDLYDYTSSKVESRTLHMQGSGTCLRSGNDVQLAPEGEDEQLAKDALVCVVEYRGTFWVDKACASKFWKIIRDTSPQGQKLSEDDIVKLGRFRFRVRQLVTTESVGVQPDLGLDSASCIEVSKDSTSTDMSSKTCRICLCGGHSDDNPLIAPCRCRGSIEYVHQKCLRAWTSSRLNLQDKPHGSFCYRPLKCELCQADYPAFVAQQSQRLPLVEVPQTQAPYVVLENIDGNSQMPSGGLHIISLAEKELTMGRAHSSDIRISDASISRCHATIRFHDGDFLLQDHASKYGTLLAMNRPQQITASQPLSLQVGRTVLSLSLTAGKGHQTYRGIAGPSGHRFSGET